MATLSVQLSRCECFPDSIGKHANSLRRGSNAISVVRFCLHCHSPGDSLWQACKAIEAGSSLVTHLFNAMRSFHHRDPGIVGLLGSDEPTFFSVIADGIHVRSSFFCLDARLQDETCIFVFAVFLKFNFCTKFQQAHDYALSLACGARPDKIIAVTDAMAAHGLPKGKHQLGKMVRLYLALNLSERQVKICIRFSWYATRVFFSAGG